MSRRQPPGGASSNIFGGPPVAAPGFANPQPPAQPAPSYQPAPSRATVPKSGPSPKVAIALCTGVGSDIVLKETLKSLKSAGINDVSSMEVNDSMMLPYTCQSLFQQYHVVLALALVTNDQLGAGSLTQTLVGALLQVATQASQPIVPGVFNPGSLLEAKVLLPDLSKKWADTTTGFLQARFGYVPVPPPPEHVPVVITPQVRDSTLLLEDFRNTLKARGTTEIFAIGRKFRIIDDDGSNSISVPELAKVLKEHRLNWTPDQVKVVYDLFDRNHDGSISYDEFLRGCRGEMNDRRKQMAMMAFEILDNDKSGFIDVNDVKRSYDTSKHPDVIAGRKTPDDVLREFLYTFEGADRDGIVTPLEFIEYYNNVSVSIDNDDYFELMIRNAWHISGGQGWCENTTCRRVLVVHADGRQTVEEIKNDLGLKANDREGMIARLRQQGIEDIVSIDLNGSMDTTTPPTNPNAKAPASLSRAPEPAARPNPGAATGFGVSTQQPTAQTTGRRGANASNRSTNLW